ncbi:MAG: formylglycine-generating enzyme family protein [Verrucomicrobiales bacterium]|nr:formylglycine-generating enzyme family protein [Verrucomicrobiales bacterium]
MAGTREYLTFLLLAAVLQALLSPSSIGAPENSGRENSLGLRLVPIEPGEYLRGALKGDTLRKNHPLSTGGVGEHNARPRHRVKLTRPFQISATEVTVGQFRKFVESTGYKTSAETNGIGAVAFLPEVKEEGVDQFDTRKDCTWKNPGFEQTDDHPVVCVSWKDAVAFCEWLSKQEKKTYRLPTEAEWEYAARAGVSTSYLGGNSAGTVYEFGNVADASLEKAHPGMTLRQRIADLEDGKGDGFAFTAPVASFKPNSWGLFDTHGNVWEWCSDKYHDLHYRELTGAHINHDDPETLPLIIDPKGPDDSPNHRYGDWRVMRGGAWVTAPLSSRCASKSYGEAGDAFCYTGFRVVLEMPEGK